MHRIICAAVIALTVLSTSAFAADPAAPAAAASAPTSTPATLPDEAVDKLDDLMSQEPTSLEQAISIMENVIKAGRDVETRYPKASDLYRVQLRMLQAASFLASQKKDAASQQAIKDIAQRILNSSAPAKDKVQADFFLTLAKVRPEGQATASATAPASKEAADDIRAMVDKYSRTDAAGRAVVLGVILAARTGQGELQDELAKQLETKYLDEEGVRGLLRKMGRHPDEGKPFEAQLTKLDGGKLSLPKDTLGKVVVIDFWATWCPPCRKTIPLLVKSYDKYKDKGVEIVAVSLDKPDQKDAISKFVQDNKMTWLQTYSGQYWLDPTAKKYGVEGIPSTWVVGRDGKIVYDGSAPADTIEELHANLEAAIDKALAAKPATATAPALAPAATRPVGK